MDFIKQYLDSVNKGFDYESLVPRVRVKYRDQLCFTGKKVDYEDFGKVLLVNGSYIPKIFYKGKSKKAIEIDVTPFLCVGGAELLNVLGEADKITLRIFYESLVKDGVFESIEQAADFARHFPVLGVDDNENYIANMLCMRSNRLPTSFKDVKAVASLLYTCAICNKPLFAEAIIQIMMFSYSFINGFINSDSDVLAYNFTNNEFAENVFKDNVFKLEAICYSSPSGKAHKISDDRGLGISFMALLMYYIYDNFGEPLKKNYINIVAQDYSKSINKLIKNCIGDDYNGRFINGKSPSMKNYKATPSSIQRGIVLTNKVKYHIDEDTSVAKDLYECNLLVHNALGLSEDVVIPELFTTHYFEIFDIPKEVGNIISIQDNLKIFDFESYVADMEKYMEETVEKMQCSLDTETMYRFAQKVESDTKEEFKSTIADYEQKIKELQEQLTVKTDLNRELSDRITSLNRELSSFFSDEDVDDTTESDVPLEDMIEFIKGYKLCMVGGRNELPSLLEGYGITNVFQVSKERGITGIPPQVDFICFNTKFISHKLTGLVRERYANQLDTTYYYNGTNVESLIRVTYHFIKDYLNS